MAGRNFPVVLLVGRNDIFADPACFLMLTSFELVSYYFRPVRNRQREIPLLPHWKRESSRERKVVKFVPGKTMNTYQTHDSRGLIYILFNCCFIQFYHLHVFHFDLTSKTKSLIYLKQIERYYYITFHLMYDLIRFNRVAFRVYNEKEHCLRWNAKR